MMKQRTTVEGVLLSRSLATGRHGWIAEIDGVGIQISSSCNDAPTGIYDDPTPRWMALVAGLPDPIYARGLREIVQRAKQSIQDDCS